MLQTVYESGGTNANNVAGIQVECLFVVAAISCAPADPILQPESLMLRREDGSLD
jgi:hypothetical protein